ncbi:MAG: transglutaminase domain-containing protein [Methanocella sp.]
MPVDSVEKYNNGYLTDPDGGDSLETSELYHFPYNEGYNIIREAALEGDNTYTPWDTAYNTLTGVFNKMDPCSVTSPAFMYTASDLWIRDNGYIGVCDDYATLYTSYSRSLGVPTRYYYVQMINSSGVQYHGMSEIWDGSRWVHSDPSWNVFNNPQVYRSSGFSYVHLWRMSDADDSYSGADPYGDRLLDCWSDFRSRIDLSEPSQYN